MMKLIRLKNMYLIFFSTFLILILSQIYVIKELNERTMASDGLIKTYQTINKIQSTFLSFTEAEKQLHFYSDTHHQKFLNSYQININETQKQLAEIKRLTIDNPSQRFKVKDLKSEIEKSTIPSLRRQHNQKSLNLSSNLLLNERDLSAELR